MLVTKDSPPIASTLQRLRSIKISRKVLFWLAPVLLLGAGGLVYIFQMRQAAASAAEPAMQTAVVQQGDLIVSASGSGVLSVEQIELEFDSPGQVTGVFVKPGDVVEKGALLAQVDEQEARIKFKQAEQKYRELTSGAAIAEAQNQVARAHASLDSARYQLEYLISPDVMYWEMEVERASQARSEAQAAMETSASNANAQNNIQKSTEYLDFAEDRLANAWDLYYEEYIPETFQIVDEIGERDIYNAPSDMEILQTRLAIEEAQDTLSEWEQYYAVLTGGLAPEEAASDALIALQEAERALEDAQAGLDGTKIYAPISGTILSVDVLTGSKIDMDQDTTAKSGAVIVMADMSEPELEFYVDETDWELVAVGNRVEIAFDSLPDQLFTGAVSEVENELYKSGNASVIKGMAQLDSDMNEINLPIGASATVDVINARVEDAVLVPIEALHETSAGAYTVFVVENDELRLQAVEVGLLGQLYAEIKTGLKAGDVVSTGLTAIN